MHYFLLAIISFDECHVIEVVILEGVYHFHESLVVNFFVGLDEDVFFVRIVMVYVFGDVVV